MCTPKLKPNSLKDEWVFMGIGLHYLSKISYSGNDVSEPKWYNLSNEWEMKTFKFLSPSESDISSFMTPVAK